MSTDPSLRIDRWARQGGRDRWIRSPRSAGAASLGLTAREVQELVDHASVVTTQKYMHVGPDCLAQPRALLVAAEVGTETGRV